MLRIPLLALMASGAWAQLGQRSIVTARAVLPPRLLYGRDNQFTCAAATDTVCPDGSGCCPGGAACFSSGGVGLCSVICEAAQPTCVFNGVTACCPAGDSCGGSLCIPATGAPAPTFSSMQPAPTITSSPTSQLAAASSSSSSPSSSSHSVVSILVVSNSSAPSGSEGGVTRITTTSTTTPSVNTNTFNLNSTATSSGPLLATVNAAPLNTLAPLVNLAAAGLAVLGLAL